MRFVLALIFAGACSLPDSDYHGGADAPPPPPVDASPDASPDASAAPPSIEVSTSVLTLAEGTSQTFMVRLADAPTSPVVVALTPATSKLELTPTMLVFDPPSYAVPQLVTATAPIDPDIIDDDDPITLTAPGATPVQVVAHILDSTDLSIAIDHQSVTLVEGSTTTLAVSLTAQPPADVVIDVVTHDAAIAQVAPSALTFTPASWSTPQLVTIDAPHDANTADDTTSITVSSAALAPREIPVLVTDLGP